MCLTIITGPMFAGKSSMLLRYKHELSNDNIIYVNHPKDLNRQSACVVTHDNNKTDCIYVEKLYHLHNKSEYIKANIVLIDECQFYDDCKEFIIQELEKNKKKFYIAGLSGDCKQNKMGNFLDLIPYADNFIFLKSKCDYCGMPASFTKKIKETQEEIGGKNLYKATCRKHLLN